MRLEAEDVNNTNYANSNAISRYNNKSNKNFNSINQNSAALKNTNAHNDLKTRRPLRDIKQFSSAENAQIKRNFQNSFGNNAKNISSNPSRDKNGHRTRNSSQPMSEQAKKQNTRTFDSSDAQKLIKLRRIRKIRNFTLIAATLLIISIIAVFTVYEFLFVIKDVEVNGLTKYDESEIMEIADTVEGKNLYSFNVAQVQDKLVFYFPYLRTVDINRVIPDTVVYNVSEETPMYYTQVYGEYFIMNSELKVLGSITEEDAKSQSLIYLKLPEVKKAVAGRAIVLSDSRNERYIRDVTADVCSSQFYENINIIDLRDKFNITMVYDEKYRLIFGSSENIDIKLQTAGQIFLDPLFQNGNKAIVDLNDITASSVIIDNQIDLS